MHNWVYLVYEICLYFIKNNDCNMNFFDMQFTNCRLAKSHDFRTCVSFSQVGNWFLMLSHTKLDINYW